MARDSGAVDTFSRYCHELMTRYGDTGFGGQEDIQEAERAAKRCLQVPSENYGAEDFERALILAERAFSWVGHTVSWLDGPLSQV
ncbi:MAG: hypothetical protein GWO24_06765, partial [Akkermansiaceae bacterium]|nr:hypothetical protein [Akkermansiaceae bacterium]